MSDIQPTITGFISPYGDYSLRNTQALSGVSHIWQDFFARALADQSGEVLPESLNFPPVDLDSPVEPTVGSELLAHIVSQRECDVKDTEVRPPEPLFLPIAEFEMDLADKPFPAVPGGRNRRSTSNNRTSKAAGFARWCSPPASLCQKPGPAPQPRPLHLPIAEFELHLLDKPFPPFSPEELVEQQKHSTSITAGLARSSCKTCASPPKPQRHTHHGPTST